MLVKDITFVDYNGVERTQTYRFNLTKSELAEMEFSVNGGIKNLIERITQTQNNPEIMALFKKILLLSYGEKSDDGIRFIKSKEISEAFSQTPAYDVLFMELMSDSKKAAEFINSILPEIPDNKNA